eukprot:CAMPEP_0178979672 /NCGR_PEP_ID=MMETSP0789-20121207/25992_1 /TAXON_ID=3005 /ORGANISM="Rhizosolenia setigera, Strain CCMP 1694" /LENGTH=974 /DNA_ID=CAMNT_0020669843 /DNA_START=274 /DNA_END=3198 /DNA_ORIENTATION=-
MNEGEVLYNAVKQSDYGKILDTYVITSKNSIITLYDNHLSPSTYEEEHQHRGWNRRTRGASVRRSGRSEFTEEKLDEFFHNPNEEYGDGPPPSRRVLSPHQILLIQALEDISSDSSMPMKCGEDDVVMGDRADVATISSDEKTAIDNRDQRNFPAEPAQAQTASPPQRSKKNSFLCRPSKKTTFPMNNIHMWRPKNNYIQNIVRRHQNHKKSSNNIDNSNERRNEAHIEEGEDAMLFSAKILSNAKPPSDFTLYSSDLKKQPEASASSKPNNSSEPSQSSSDDDEANAIDAENQDALPLFDGSSNTNGNGGNTTGGGTNNSSTSLHLACIMDEPFTAAILMVLGADIFTSRHSAFRRLPVHEAACYDSVDCMKLLLLLNSSEKDCNESRNTMDYETHMSMDMDTSESLNTEEFNDTHQATTGDSESIRHIKDLSPFISTLYLIQSLIEHIDTEGNGNGSINQNTLTPLQAAIILLKQAPCFHIANRNLSPSSSGIQVTSSPSLRHHYCFKSKYNILNVSDGHGNTALHWASFKNCVETVDLLLEHGADPNCKAQPSGWTPLHDAAYSDSYECTKLLLEKGADINAKANSGATPLCFAAQEDAPKAMELLLKANADMSIRCCGPSSSPYQYQPQRPTINTTNNINNRNRNSNPLNHIFSSAQASNSSRFSGYTPLHYAAHYNASKAAKMLTKYGAPMEIPDLCDRFPIHVAVTRGSSDVLKVLLTAGARVQRSQSVDYGHQNRASPVQRLSRYRSNSFHLNRTNNTTNTAGTTMPIQVPLNFNNIRNSNQNRSSIQSTSPLLLPAGTSNNNDTHAGAAVSPPVNSPTLLNNPHLSPRSPPSRQNSNSNIPTSPVLKALVPRHPIHSAKPWNCLSQKRIDKCLSLIDEIEQNWSPNNHILFSPQDRKSILELMRVGKRLEREKALFMDMWPLVLSFCGRGWFEQDEDEQYYMSTTIRFSGENSEEFIEDTQFPLEG